MAVWLTGSHFDFRWWGVAMEWEGVAWSNQERSIQHHFRVAVCTSSRNSCFKANWVSIECHKWITESLIHFTVMCIYDTWHNCFSVNGAVILEDSMIGLIFSCIFNTFVRVFFFLPCYWFATWLCSHVLFIISDSAVCSYAVAMSWCLSSFCFKSELWWFLCFLLRIFLL